MSYHVFETYVFHPVYFRKIRNYSSRESEYSFRHLVSTGGGHLHHLPQAVTAPGNWSNALACFSVVTIFPGKCQILYFFPFLYCSGRLGKCAIKVFWLSYFLNDNSYRSIIIFLLLAKEYFFLFFFHYCLPLTYLFLFHLKINKLLNSFTFCKVDIFGVTKLKLFLVTISDLRCWEV